VTRIVPNNQISLLQNGEAYFPAIETALDRAIHEIYLESYIFENDNTGRRIGEALRRASLRGVKNPRSDRWIRLQWPAENHGRIP